MSAPPFALTLRALCALAFFCASVPASHAALFEDSEARRAILELRQRVDTLQQLVGIETTNRLYASRGQTYDVALVSID